MLSKALPIAVLAAALVVVPVSAQAAESDLYTPTPKDAATLAGSFAVVECSDDVPVINYSVDMIDPADTVTTDEATLVLTSGADSVTIPLGTLVDNHLEGTVVWPGAAVENGVASGWPGWERSNGTWAETSGNYAWTRGSITATLVVDPEIAVPLSYPAANSGCASPAGFAASPTSASASQPLAVTGLDSWVIPTGLGALGVALLGFVLVFARRTRRAQH